MKSQEVKLKEMTSPVERPAVSDPKSPTPALITPATVSVTLSAEYRSTLDQIVNLYHDDSAPALC